MLSFSLYHSDNFDCAMVVSQCSETFMVQYEDDMNHVLTFILN